jgi:hypothetical protein
MGNYGMHLQYCFFGTVEMNTPWMVFYKDYIVSFALFLPLKTACLAEKQQMPVPFFSLWFDMTMA